MLEELQERIGASLQLDGLRSNLAVLSDDLMHLLAIRALIHGRHQDVLGGEKRQFFRQCPCHDLGIDGQAAGDVVHKIEMASMAKNAWGMISRRIALSSSVRSSHCVAAVCTAPGLSGHDEAREGADTFATHRVPLVGHGRRPHLAGLEWLVQFLAAGEQPQVRGCLMGRLGNSRQCVQDLSVDFARIGLASDRIRLVESHFVGDTRFQSDDPL